MKLEAVIVAVFFAKFLPDCFDDLLEYSFGGLSD